MAWAGCVAYPWERQCEGLKTGISGKYRFPRLFSYLYKSTEFGESIGLIFYIYEKDLFCYLRICSKFGQGGQSPKSKIHSVITEHLEKKHMTYSPIDFGEKIDTIYSTLSENGPYQIFTKAFQETKFEFDIALAKGDIEGADIYLETLKKYSAKLDSIEKNFVSNVIGYSIDHAYKVNDITMTNFFVVDTTLTKVIKEGVTK